MSGKSSSFLSLVSLVFVIGSLFTFVSKNFLLGGWTADSLQISPLRWVSATAVSVAVTSWGHGRNSLSTSGALLALLVGFCLTLAHVSFLFALLVFFLSSSKATKFKQDIKKRFESDFKEGGQRNWLQVLCNGGMATELSLLYLLDVGSADLPVDFRHHYRASWLGMGILGALACCNGDTWASELGSVLSKDEPILITTLKKVPRGTNGAISFPGLVVSFFGGMVIGVAYACGIYLATPNIEMAQAPEQWKIIIVGGLAGLFGSIVDSLLGATVQYSGRDKKTGKIVEVAKEGVSKISGRMILDNHSVNLVSSIITALVTPKIALAMGM
jgi:uncharacterized protein (TIGR00297 family)